MVLRRGMWPALLLGLWGMTCLGMPEAREAAGVLFLFLGLSPHLPRAPWAGEVFPATPFSRALMGLELPVAGLLLSRLGPELGDLLPVALLVSVLPLSLLRPQREAAIPVLLASLGVAVGMGSGTLGEGGAWRGGILGTGVALCGLGPGWLSRWRASGGAFVPGGPGSLTPPPSSIPALAGRPFARSLEASCEALKVATSARRCLLYRPDGRGAGFLLAAGNPGAGPSPSSLRGDSPLVQRARLEGIPVQVDGPSSGSGGFPFPAGTWMGPVLEEDQLWGLLIAEPSSGQNLGPEAHQTLSAITHVFASLLSHASGAIPRPSSPASPHSLATGKPTSSATVQRHPPVTPAVPSAVEGPEPPSLSQSLAAALASLSADTEEAVICLLSIDHLQEIRRVHGLEAENEAILRLTSLIRGAVPPGQGFWVRQGGEEFVLFRAGGGPSSGRALIESIRERLEGEVPGGGSGGNAKPFRCTLSAGVAEFPQDGKTPEILLSQARAALLYAKASGGNRVVGAGNDG